MKYFFLILAIVLIVGCTQPSKPLTWVCPDGTEVLGGPSQCPETSFCKGTARCFNGAVTKVVDGDTLDVNNISIRLTLVNAPEYTERDGSDNEEGGFEAMEFASSVCPIGSKAIVDEDDGQTAGSYGRIIAVVYCNGRNLNAKLLDNGKATIDQNFCNVSEFANENWVKTYGC
jgi:micrococcal nuclease